MATQTQRTGIFESKVQDDLIDALQLALYDLSGMVNVTKQCHWNVQGPHFREIHLQLDEIYATLTTSVDDVAERLVTLGGAASGQSPEVAANSKVPTVPQGFLRDMQVIDLMTERLAILCRNVRAQMERTEDPDPVTADLLHGIVEALEKHHWMLRSHHPPKS